MPDGALKCHLKIALVDHRVRIPEDSAVANKWPASRFIGLLDLSGDMVRDIWLGMWMIFHGLLSILVTLALCIYHLSWLDLNAVVVVPLVAAKFILLVLTPFVGYKMATSSRNQAQAMQVRCQPSYYSTSIRAVSHKATHRAYNYTSMLEDVARATMKSWLTEWRTLVFTEDARFVVAFFLNCVFVVFVYLLINNTNGDSNQHSAVIIIALLHGIKVAKSLFDYAILAGTYSTLKEVAAVFNTPTENEIELSVRGDDNNDTKQQQQQQQQPLLLLLLLLLPLLLLLLQVDIAILSFF